MQLVYPLSASRHGLHPLMADPILFVLVKSAFVALLSGTVWLDSSSPIFISGMVNCIFHPIVLL